MDVGMDESGRTAASGPEGVGRSALFRRCKQAASTSTKPMPAAMRRNQLAATIPTTKRHQGAATSHDEQQATHHTSQSPESRRTTPRAHDRLVGRHTSTRPEGRVVRRTTRRRRGSWRAPTVRRHLEGQPARVETLATVIQRRVHHPVGHLLTVLHLVQGQLVRSSSHLGELPVDRVASLRLDAERASVADRSPHLWRLHRTRRLIERGHGHGRGGRRHVATVCLICDTVAVQVPGVGAVGALVHRRYDLAASRGLRLGAEGMRPQQLTDELVQLVVVHAGSVDDHGLPEFRRVLTTSGVVHDMLVTSDDVGGVGVHHLVVNADDGAFVEGHAALHRRCRRRTDLGLAVLHPRHIRVVTPVGLIGRTHRSLDDRVVLNATLVNLDPRITELVGGPVGILPGGTGFDHTGLASITHLPFTVPLGTVLVGATGVERRLPESLDVVVLPRRVRVRTPPLPRTKVRPVTPVTGDSWSAVFAVEPVGVPGRARLERPVGVLLRAAVVVRPLPGTSGIRRERRLIVLRSLGVVRRPVPPLIRRSRLALDPGAGLDAGVLHEVPLGLLVDDLLLVLVLRVLLGNGSVPIPGAVLRRQRVLANAIVAACVGSTRNAHRDESDDDCHH